MSTRSPSSVAPVDVGAGDDDLDVEVVAEHALDALAQQQCRS